MIKCIDHLSCCVKHINYSFEFYWHNGINEDNRIWWPLNVAFVRNHLSVSHQILFDSLNLDDDFVFLTVTSHSTEDAKYTFSLLRCFVSPSSRELYENGHNANYVQCIISYNLFKCFGAKDQIANGKTISMWVEKRSQLACEANFTRRHFFLLTHHKCKKLFKPYIVYTQTIFIHAGFDKAKMDLKEFAIENEQ